MSRCCELTGKGVQSGNHVSHANNKSRRRFLPHLCRVSLVSDGLSETFSLRVSAYALRCVEHQGGLDAFLLSAPVDTPFSLRVKRLKARLVKARGVAAAPDQV